MNSHMKCTGLNEVQVNRCFCLVMFGSLDGEKGRDKTTVVIMPVTCIRDYLKKGSDCWRRKSTVESHKGSSPFGIMKGRRRKMCLVMKSHWI